MIRLSSAVAALAVFMAGSPTLAAPVNPQQSQGLSYQSFVPTGFAQIVAGTTSSNIALGSTGSQSGAAFTAWVQNLGTVGVNVIVGTDGTIAVTPTSGLYIPPGACASLAAMSGGTPGTYLAAVTASGTAQVNVITGYGTPGNACAGAGSASAPSTNVGATPLSRLVSSAATTNATTVKASAGRLYRIFGCNTTTSPVYIKLYNTASVPIPGTTPVFDSRPLPPAAASGGLSCQAFDVVDYGWSFSSGIGYALTTGNADSDATAPVAGAVVQLVFEGT